MGRAIKVQILTKTFSKKGDLIAFLRLLVNRYHIGDYLNAFDFDFCIELFKYHADYPNKLMPGVNRIQILIQKEGTRGFQIHKTDGTSDDISWTDCVRNIK